MDKNQPQLEIVPLCAGVRRAGLTELDVVVRVTAPQVAGDEVRPALNVGLVIDRSGSMSGEKLRAAKAAAAYAVRCLENEDRVSVTVFDDEVQTIVPSTAAHDRAAILRRIEGVQCGGSTALHAGWLEGGVQVSRYLDAKRLNRVILLTDGQANVGEVNADRIASDVKGLAQRGVGTTTMGVGADFNEKLLEAMANSGDGNFYYIAEAAQLEAIFAQEFSGLAATTGRMVSFGIEPQGEVFVEDVLSDFERNENGRLLLPNLIAGRAVEIVLRLSVPAPREGQTDEICAFRLAWTEAQSGQRFAMRVALRLPVLEESAWQALPVNLYVREQVAHKQALRIQQRAIKEMEAGDFVAASAALDEQADFLRVQAPAAAYLKEELSDIAELKESIAERRHSHATKAARFGRYRKTRGQ